MMANKDKNILRNIKQSTIQPFFGIWAMLAPAAAAIPPPQVVCSGHNHKALLVEVLVAALFQLCHI
jgi:hypothetical protein